MSSGALGRTGERSLGLQSIALESVIGTVDRRHGSSTAASARVEPAAATMGEHRCRPPARAFDAADRRLPRRRAALRHRRHHRVSVARAHGDTHIDARVREVQIRVPVSDDLMLRDLLLTRHEREFDERVPLPPAARARIELSEAWRYEQLSKHFESWAYRASQADGRLLSRAAAAEELVSRGVRAGRRRARRARHRRRRHRNDPLSPRRAPARSPAPAQAGGATTSSSDLLDAIRGSAHGANRRDRPANPQRDALTRCRPAGVALEGRTVSDPLAGRCLR